MNDEHAFEHEHEHDPAAGHETRDASAGAIVTYGIGLTFVLIVVHLGLLGVYRWMKHERLPEPTVKTPMTIYEQLRTLRRTEDETLASYGWVDRKAGIVRIPIERAIDLAAARGVRKGKGPRTEAEINSHHGTPAKEQAETKDSKP